MGVIGLFRAGWRTSVFLHCFVMITHTQSPPSLNLPVQISVPSPWDSLPVSQAELGLLFTNSSPYAFVQSLLLIPPVGTTSRPVLHASFGPYSVSQLVSESITPPSAPVVAYLLSKTRVVEKKGQHGEQLKVRVLFHVRGDTNRGTCVTLHAFKQTEELKASCITKPPHGLCLVTMTISIDWFNPEEDLQLHTNQKFRPRLPNRLRARSRGLWRPHPPASLRVRPGSVSDMIQLYYSSFVSGFDHKTAPYRCREDKRRHSQRNLHHIGSVQLSEISTKSNQMKDFTCFDLPPDDEIWLNTNVLVRYNKGPVRAGQPIGVEIKIKANYSGDYLIVRLKVKKGLLSVQIQPSTTSDLWTVNVEWRTGSRHDIISLICHRSSSPQNQTGVLTLHRVVCLTVEGLNRSHGVALTVAVHWWVEYTARNTLFSPHGAITSRFTFTDREIVGIAPITESNTIINTAILTGQPVSLLTVVLGVEQDGKVSDITMAVRCQSANEDIVKVSSDCSTLFVDGSESGTGSTCVEVEFSLGRLRDSLCLTVWAPLVPLRILLSDSVLSPIDGWSHQSETRCTPVYQRSTVQVTAQFSAQQAEQGGKLIYMLGSHDWFVDVTNLVYRWLQIKNPRVAKLHKQNYLIGLEPGVTSLNLVSGQWDGVLGSADVIVTSESVSPSDLSVQLVGGLGLSVFPSPSHPAIITASVTSHNVLYNHGQEAWMSVWLEFSDDTAVLLSTFSGVPFSLQLSSLAESVVIVTPAPAQRVLAQGDGGGPLLKAELLVSTCGNESLRLAKGSGWIRVNLDSEFWPLESDDFKMTDASYTLEEEYKKNMYHNFGEEHTTMNSSYGPSGKASDDVIGLEWAVLPANHEEPEMEMEKENEEEPADERVIGLGAVFSLVLLAFILCLGNIVPCALRRLRKRRRELMDQSEVERKDHTRQREEEIRNVVSKKKVSEEKHVL